MTEKCGEIVGKANQGYVGQMTFIYVQTGILASSVR